MHGSILTLSLLCAAAPTIAAERLPIDASHSAVIFSWNHRGYSHPVARMEKVSGVVMLDRAAMGRSVVSVTLPIEGLRTGDDALDRRLKGPEFFDAAHFPAITFQSTRIAQAGPQTLTIVGDLSVHGVSRPVEITATINRIDTNAESKLTAGFDGDLTLRRSDFGLGRYVPMTSDEIVVHLTVEASQD